MKTIKPLHLLLAGTLLIMLGHIRYGMGFFAILEPIPFLLYLDRKQNLRSMTYLGIALMIGWTLAVAKIVTDPIPLMLSPVFALPITLSKFGAYLSYRPFRQSKQAGLLFAALFTLGEWVLTTFTPFATWGAMVYTQLDNISWLQIVSVGGPWILSFALYFIAFQLYRLTTGNISRNSISAIALPVLLLSLFGTARLALSEDLEQPTVTVAAIGTDSQIGGAIFPTQEERESVRSALYQRMAKSQQSGSSLVVWTEAAAGILPSEEAAFKLEVSDLVDSLDITAVVSYVVPLQFDPLLYENKAIIINQEGQVVQSYLKHEPVPGEPAVKGVSEHEVYDMGDYQLGKAICYDFDFPGLAREIAAMDAHIVALPSSDWRGIDPIHTQMAALRAIEGGFSLVRSTRWGLSAAVDPYGRFRAWRSDFDNGEKILVAQLPVGAVDTPYERWGDWFIYLCLGLIGYNTLSKLRSKPV